MDGEGAYGARTMAVLGLFVGPPVVQPHARVAVLRGELDTGVFQRVLDLAQAFDGSLDRAFTALHALHRRDVDAGPLRKLPSGPPQEAAGGANLLWCQFGSHGVPINWCAFARKESRKG